MIEHFSDDKTYEIAVTYFIQAKDRALNSISIPNPAALDKFIDEAGFLGLVSTEAQLIRVRDHYYPESK